MPQMDGAIRIGTKIETKEAERELKSLFSSMEKTAKEIDSLSSKTKSFLENAKVPTREYEMLQEKLKAANKEVDYLTEKQKQYKNLGFEIIPQEMLNQAKSEVEEIEKRINQLVDSGKAFTLGDEDAEKYAQMTAQMEQLTNKMQSDQQRAAEIQSALAAEEERIANIKANATKADEQIIGLLERKKQLTQEIADMERAGVGLGYKEYDLAQQELAQLNYQVKEYKNNLSQIPTRFNEMKKSAKKAFDAIGSGTKKSNGLLSSFAGRVKAIAATVLIFNLIRKAFNAMIEMMKQGFSNFMKYSSDFANSVQSMKNAASTLGNQLAAAFAPIVQLIIPWLTKLINVITTAMTYVAQFIAILGGKSTFTRAKQVQDSYNKSLGGTAAAAKKAYGALAKFDDLDVLQKQEDDAGGGAADAMGDLFEEVPVDSKFKDWLDGILEKLKPILDYLKKLKDIFMQGFWDGLGDWEYRWEIIKNSLASIKDSLIDIFTDPAVLAAADGWAQSVAYMLGSLAGSVASIGLTIAANILGGIAKYLEQNKDRIKEHLISMFDIWTEVNYMFADLFQSIAYVFEAFASDQGQQLTANLIGIFADAFMGILELASKIFRDVANLIIQPFVDNKEEFRVALEGFLQVLADVTGTIKQGIDDTFDKLNEVYDAHFRPFFESVAQGLSDLVAKFLEFWNGNVQPILQQWAADFDDLWTGHIQPLLDNAAEFLGKVADLLKALWENILQPFIAWITQNILPYILPVIQAIWDLLVDFVAFVTEMVDSLITIFSGIIDFLTGVFTGDWELAFQGLEEIVSGFIDLVFSIIESFFALIRDTLNLFFEVIKNTVEAALQFLSDLVNKILTTIKNYVVNKQTEIVQATQNFIENVKNKWNAGWEALKSKVSAIMDEIKSILLSAFEWISGIVDKIMSKLGGIGSAVSGISGGLGGAFGGSIGISAFDVNQVPVIDVPHLASGSVIRGGNPFLAMLGDQPHGQTNIEAPLSTIKQAVREELSGMNYGGGLNPIISLNVNGEEFARLTLNDILSEMSRQGYDVEILGVT